MSLDHPFLIKFLIISFSLEGSVSMNTKIHGILGSQIILSAPYHTATPHIIEWTRNSTQIAELINTDKSNTQPEPKEYHILLNGSLKINTLKKKDAGIYKVDAHDKKGIRLFHGSVTLYVDEPNQKLQPKLTEFCSKRILECEVKSSEKPKPRFQFFQNTQETKIFQGPVYDNETWKVTLQIKVLSGKFRCEVHVNSEKNHTEKEITCSGVLDSVPMVPILTITGGTVALIIFMASIIYFIRKKKAKRHEQQVQEHALQVQIQGHVKHRRLPQIPICSGSNLPPHSELQQQNGPSPPKSHPHPKPPRRMKERP